MSAEVADNVGGVALERCTLARADRLERGEADPAPFELPACDGAPADERERPEHPSVEHASAVFGCDDRAPVDPAVEEWVEGAEEAGRRQPRRRRRPGEGDQPVALDEIELSEAGSDVAQREPGPAREVAVACRPVTDEIAARQLAQRPVALHVRLRAEPVADEGVRVLLPEHRPTHREPVDRRPEEDVEQSGALRRDSVTLELLSELDPRRRAIGKSPLEQR